MERFTERGGWWVAAQGVFFVAVLLAGMARPAPFGQTGAAEAVRMVAGWVLLITGAIGAAAAMLHLGESLTPFPAPLGGARFASGGMYRMVRHPIYGGVTVMAVGYALVRGDAAALLVAGGLFPFFFAKASFEERLLVARYPEYVDYRRRVRKRLIPGLF